MKAKMCPLCGSKMLSKGKTSAGKKRWKCAKCNISTTNKYDSNIKWYKRFINWLFSKNSLQEQNVSSRTLSRHNQTYWKYWAMPHVYYEEIDVLYIDGIWLSRSTTILIASTKEYVISWYLARSEKARSWIALLSRIPKPKIVVTDGNNGILKALKELWPDVAIQRCIFHVQAQIQRATTTRPKLKAGQKLRNLSLHLSKIKTYEQAEAWVEAYTEWLYKWNDFLQEKTIDEYGNHVYKHRRLRSARRAINKILNSGTMFTYLNPLLNDIEEIPSTNNRLEGGVNAQLRRMLRNHRGLVLEKRIKAVFLWCYYHSPYPKKATYILQHMPTDETIDEIYKSLTKEEKHFAEIEQWGDAVVWSELHNYDENFFNNI